MFLPVSKKDMKDRGWDEIDFLIVTGDAYVDHPSFGTAIISRVLEAEGFRVGILAAPNYKDLQDFRRFGRPKYAAMVSAGNIDSMVSNYTAAKKRRSDDAYSAGGKGGSRPDYAATVYCKKIREVFPDLPVILGGLEASLRRFAHYDYWKDTVLPSVLVESGADLLTYGMGENQTIQIARRLSNGEDINDLTDILGTCYISDFVPDKGGIFLPSFEQTKSDKKAYATAARIELEEQDHIRGKALYQKHDKKYLVQNPPMPPLTTEELDRVYSLPFERYYHPIYEKMGGVPAIAEVEFSITHNRGCFGACNFCSLAFHQGRYITCRSKESLVEEAKSLTQNPRFKGYIHDVGGPTANFRRPSCDKQIKSGLCKNKKCLAPVPCPALKVEHREYLDILRTLREIPKVKKVFVRSGIRFDYLCEDRDDEFFRELVEHHISGQLKVAPEHCSSAVLDKMGKPHIEAYLRFKRKYNTLNKEFNKEQYLVPYLMSSHPGCTLKDSVELALFLKKDHIRPQQVQDFYPTPGTISTAMFYTELDPYTMEKIYVPKTYEDKQMQRALLQYFKPENEALVRTALIKAGRSDLIGFGEKYLVRPDRNAKNTKENSLKNPSKNSTKNKNIQRKRVSHKWEPKGNTSRKKR